MRIVLLGKPGSGKGTQAKLLEKEFGAKHLSSGQILRAEAAAGTELGRKVETVMKRGEIGPAELITETIINHISRKGLGDRYILDGFPRTLYQAEALEETFAPRVAIHISVPDEVVVERLSKRLICTQCEAIYHETTNPPRLAGICDSCGGKLVKREDDNTDAIRKRLDVFLQDTTPIIRFYEARGKALEVEGTGKPSDIHTKIMALLSKRGIEPPKSR